MGIYFVITLLLINGTAIFLFFLSVSPKIKAKNLSSIMICLGINLIISPAAFLIGGIADYAGVAANYGAYFAGESATAPPLVSRALYFSEDFSLFREFHCSYYLQLFGSLQGQRK